MTLRLALLLVSLILLGIIGLVCHQRYSNLNPKSSLKKFQAHSGSNSALEEDINSPYISQEVVSDISSEDSSLLKPVDIESEHLPDELELSPLLDSKCDEKPVTKDQDPVLELLPKYASGELIVDHVAALPNVNTSSIRIKKFVEKSVHQLARPLWLQVQIDGSDEFCSLAEVVANKKIKHIKIGFQLRSKLGPADLEMIDDYERFVGLLASEFGCEYRFSMPSEHALTAAKYLDEFCKENDFIVVVYILAKPHSEFKGKTIHKALLNIGLKYGEFKFYNYFSKLSENQNMKLFSVANMYKPGNFDFETLEQFTTMGLCAFMVPVLLNEPVAGFKEMSNSCHKIADELGGILTTSNRELLTENHYRVICNQIIEHTKMLKKRGIVCGSEVASRLFV